MGIVPLVPRVFYPPSHRRMESGAGLAIVTIEGLKRNFNVELADISKGLVTSASFAKKKKKEATWGEN